MRASCKRRSFLLIIDLSCPIELRSYELLHDDAGTVRAVIELFNLSDDTLLSYSATVLWTRDDTGEQTSENVSVDAIAIPGGGFFELMLSSSLIRYADRLELFFTRARFEDADDWTPRDGDLVDVGEQVAAAGAELSELRAAAGPDAVMYPETQDKFWRCVCGRINALDTYECARCRREREYVLQELNRKALHRPAGEAAKAARRRRRAKAASGRSEEARAAAVQYTALIVAAALAFIALLAVRIFRLGI